MQNLTNKDKDRLAILNGLTDERYGDKVRGGAKKTCPFLEDEIAELRKGLAHLYDVLADKFGVNIRSAEFDKHNSIIEGVKAEAKADLGQD